MAVDLGIVAVSPLGATPRPTKGRSVAKHWTPEQAREFLDLHAYDREWAVWAFLLGGGLRIGELVALRWPHIDLKRHRAEIVEFSTTLGYKVVASSGKSRDATRSIELDDGLVEVLKGQRRLQAEEKLAAVEYLESDYVLHWAGGPYHPQTLSKMLARLSAQAGLPRLTAHGLRHTSATLMLAEGVQPKVAAERLGRMRLHAVRRSTAMSPQRCNASIRRAGATPAGPYDASWSHEALRPSAMRAATLMRSAPTCHSAEVANRLGHSVDARMGRLRGVRSNDDRDRSNDLIDSAPPDVSWETVEGVSQAFVPSTILDS